MPAKPNIAERRLLATDASGREFAVTLGVGSPYEVSDGEWACPASLEGLHDRLIDVRGVDSWQALQLAHQLIMRLLIHFVQGGGRLFWPEGEEPVSLDELWPDFRGPSAGTANAS